MENKEKKAKEKKLINEVKGIKIIMLGMLVLRLIATIVQWVMKSK